MRNFSKMIVDNNMGERNVWFDSNPMKMDVGNSTQILTDMTTAIANQPYSATATAAAIAAAGPIEDLPGMVKSVLLSFQEIQMKLNYILGGSMVSPASLTAPTGGLLTTSSDSATYNLLVGIFQILK
jgi:hypothetical protein